MSNQRHNEDSVKKIISKVAGYPMDEIHDDIHIRDDLLIDSLKQMEIIARIEHQFGIPLDEGKLANLETLGDFLDLINQQILISN
ncbi:MAG: acyl carrier protein [Spirochaetes bacterium]|nr:MAG: acyl carrier protein [Spirochaetota bacterium]RKX97669.1 MAG: acyl carrier protein [Spirochaetota bacterium]